MGFKLFNIATVKTNLPDADFWVIRKGSSKEVGRPVREFHKERIGVKVSHNEVALGGYLFYVVDALRSIGYFERRAKGTLDLKHITVDDVGNIELG